MLRFPFHSILPRIRRFGLSGLVLLWLASPALAVDIEDVRFWRSDEYSRVVFDVDARVEYSVFLLEEPARVVIDVSDSRMLGETDSLDFSGSPVTGIRSAPRDGSDTRVVLDLSRAVNPTSFTLPPNEEFGHRLVVDLYDINRETPVRETATAPQPEFDQRRDIVVAIDPGHGGDDPGAIGYDGNIREKDVALAISGALHQRLQAEEGYQPVMLRDADYYVQLQQRPQLARQNRADIFLSIHADSFRSSNAEGVTVYALSQSVAEDENTRRVAQKENAAALLGGTGGDTSLSDFEDDLALTLLDLSMSWSIEQSMEAGSAILDSLGGVTRLRRDKPQQGNLWVLRSPDIPSLLIETGYLSNPPEARRLTSSAYQRRLADAIARGVKDYFYDKPPEGTLIAYRKANGIAPPSTHTVRRGESLSLIAQRYDTTVSRLRSHNGLNSNVIRVGQQLSIPGRRAPSVSAHTISRGETLSGIAQQYRISLSRLREANDLNGDTIRVGQELIIPAH